MSTICFSDVDSPPPTTVATGRADETPLALSTAECVDVLPGETDCLRAGERQTRDGGGEGEGGGTSLVAEQDDPACSDAEGIASVIDTDRTSDVVAKVMVLPEG